MKKVSSPIFPDVNVLIALVWMNHPHHPVARARMTGHQGPWLTCVVTQLGFIRLSSNSAVTKHIVSPRQASELLTSLMEDPMHVYVPDSASIVNTRGIEVLRRAMGHSQVTDAYLLALAAANGARFVTFDSRLTELARGVCQLEVLS